MKDLAVNRRARFDYEILETFEAGIALLGFEVKSVKNGRMSLAGAYAVVRDEELWLLNATISPWQQNNTPKDYEPGRSRRLLLHKQEIRQLIGSSAQKGLTIVPLRVYNKNDKIKLLIGLARHKKTQDKRETIKRRDTEREVRRTLKME